MLGIWLIIDVGGEILYLMFLGMLIGVGEQRDGLYFFQEIRKVKACRV